MSEINYQALREAAQNYQSTLAWYEAITDNPNAEQDCSEAVAAFKRQIRHQEMDIIAELLEELETKDNRIAELEKIATDHALKFQKAQDALKYAALLHSRTAQQTNNFAVLLPDISEYFINNVFQPLRYERDVERAIIKAGGKALWQEKHEDRTHQSCDVNRGWFSSLTTDKNNTCSPSNQGDNRASPFCTIVHKFAQFF
ncbi:TPA: ead/Ea22-like family protein [Escherichia coli]|uniref:ead/Ea22-like family protein n=1 Tax=Escherichia coli TaxID=562 RepID=UPI0002243437|nr:ead/Ea22-like family protein [Escherichia coli]EEQ9747785.1 ead/Ea22-like family protein [Escherichia coli]EFG2177270.1 ead/Ea22-like family protein [Escherichia coli]EFJ5716172.1 ead/Ea22-like family protein [Escherichia coli]EFL5789732.1 ead/Ea22-like family protein [Escherichia coli]EHV5930031.1 ead/Ea22-like family protein [Escherichia coli]